MRKEILSRDFRMTHSNNYQKSLLNRINGMSYLIGPDSYVSDIAAIDQISKDIANGIIRSDDLVNVPSLKYRPSGYGKKVHSYSPDEVIEQIHALIGKGRSYGFDSFIPEFESMVKSGVDNPDVWNKFFEYLGSDYGSAWISMSHLTELSEATDLSRIPKRWRQRFNKYITDIVEHDVNVNGYCNVINEIEGAYNIYKLSTGKEAIQYGLSKLNENYPHQIFEVFSKNHIPAEYYPSANLFAYDDVFVPWYDSVVTKDIGSAYFAPKFNHVSISKNYFDESIGRCSCCYEEARTVFTHEYGHVYDNIYGIGDNNVFKSMFSKYATKYDSFTEEELIEKFNDAVGKQLESLAKITDSKKLKIAERELNERMSSLSDIVESLRTDKLQLRDGYGHDKDYFSDIRSRYKEFIAHMSEIYYHENELIREFDKELYQDMYSMMRKIRRYGIESL